MRKALFVAVLLLILSIYIPWQANNPPWTFGDKNNEVVVNSCEPLAGYHQVTLYPSGITSEIQYGNAVLQTCSFAKTLSELRIKHIDVNFTVIPAQLNGTTVQYIVIE